MGVSFNIMCPNSSIYSDEKIKGFSGQDKKWKSETMERKENR